MAQRLKAGGNASSKKNFTQRQVPAIPKDYIPRGSPARAAARAGLDCNPAPVLGRRTRKHPGTLPALSLGKPKITFVTQQDSVFFLSTIAVDKFVGNLLIAMLTRLSITIFPVTPNFLTHNYSLQNI